VSSTNRFDPLTATANGSIHCVLRVELAIWADLELNDGVVVLIDDVKILKVG
jgi:hypothetical protein